MQTTTLIIEILLHYNWDIMNDVEGYDCSPATIETLEMLVASGILKKKPEGMKGPTYVANKECLSVYIKALCDVPLPVHTWTIPERK